MSDTVSYASNVYIFLFYSSTADFSIHKGPVIQPEVLSENNTLAGLREEDIPF